MSTHEPKNADVVEITKGIASLRRLRAAMEGKRAFRVSLSSDEIIKLILGLSTSGRFGSDEEKRELRELALHIWPYDKGDWIDMLFDPATPDPMSLPGDLA